MSPGKKFLAAVGISLVALGTAGVAHAGGAPGSACTGNNPVCQLPTADGDDATAPNGQGQAYAVTTFKDGQITSQLAVCPDQGRANCVVPVTLGPVPGRYVFDNKTRIGNLTYSHGGSNIFSTASQEGLPSKVFVLNVPTLKKTYEFDGSGYEVVPAGRFKGDLAVTSNDLKSVTVVDPNTGGTTVQPMAVAEYKSWLQSQKPAARSRMVASNTIK